MDIMTTAATSYRAWRCHAFGDYHDLRLETVPGRGPGAGELLIDNRAFAPGFPDMLMVQGGYQHKPTLPFTPCSEFAGEVIACGPEVSGFAVGDRIMGTLRAGAAAAQFIARAEDCLALPANWDFVAGAAFLVGGKTAYVGLLVRGQMRAGETVLVHGAGGGVGLAAVDLAKLHGARVIAMANGAEKLAVATARGADAVIDYRDGSFRQQVKALTDGRGADLIYDPVGGDVFDESMHAIAPFGRLLVIGFASGRIPSLAVNYALIKQISVVGVRAGEYGRLDPAGGRRVQAALAGVADGDHLRPYIHARLPFTALREAFDAIARREVIGRIVLEC